MSATTERLWIGTDGKYQVQASYVCLFQDKKVKLRKPNGALIAIPLNVLCPEDIAFIATQSKLLRSDTTNLGRNSPKTLVPDDPPPMTASYSSTETTITLSELNKTEAYQPTVVDPQQITTKPAMNVRHISENESTQMIPVRSLSSITNEFKRQTFLPENQHTNIKNLANLPSRVVNMIACHLDVHSKIRLSTTNRRLHQIIFKPAVWARLSFNSSAKINDEVYYQCVVYLQQRGSLQKVIKHVNLDHTLITSASVLLSIKYLENLETLSIQSCWQLFTFKLATDLTQLATRSPQAYPSRVSEVTLGKVLHRGPITTPEGQKALDSKSFGQDAWFINSALNKLTGKNVLFDVVLCGSCHVGASSQEFHCFSCGILPLKKCVSCAPRCDRCGSRTCNLPTCDDPKIKVQIAKCGRCESTLALCNNDKSQVCQDARQPCESCHRLYHVRCRTVDGTYVSNQCVGCGVVACPHCELSSCSGGCHGQWCRKCVPRVDLGYCKCIVIKGSADSSSKSLTKRNVCGRCRKTCNQCQGNHFCERCLNVHGSKCT